MHASRNYRETMTYSEGRRFSLTVIIIFSLLLLMSAAILSIIGALSPSWQVVDIREFQAEHHHGIWLDCTRSERHFMSQLYEERSPLHCTYKFDSNAAEIIDKNIEEPDMSAAAAEADHHHFFGWHKAVLIMMVVSLLTVGMALFCGICAPCSSSCSLIYSILSFVAFLTSAGALATFFFAAHRVDIRFVQGLVATYEQEIGSAFFFYGAGTLLLLLASIISVIVTYQLLRSSEGGSNFGMRELAPLYRSGMATTVI